MTNYSSMVRWNVPLCAFCFAVVVDAAPAVRWTRASRECRLTGDSVVFRGFGTVEWTGECNDVGKDSLELLGRLGPSVASADPMEAPKVRWVFPRAASESKGPLRWGRWTIGPFDSLRVEGGAIHASAGRSLRLVGMPDSMRLEPVRARPTAARRPDPERTSDLESGIRPGGASWIWTDGERLASVHGVSLLPRLRVRFDSGEARVLSRRKGEITFAVDAVKPNRGEARELPDSGWRARRVLDQGDSMVWIAGEKGAKRLVEDKFGHAFAGTFLAAWNEHRPVRISPDAVWMVLLESMVNRISGNAEACRVEMVRSPGGKDTVAVVVDADFEQRRFQPAQWRKVVDLLLDSMDRKVVANRHRALVPNFTTTTPVRAMAHRMRVLELYHNYFDYSVEVGCGIPSITLEGSPEDWERIRRDIDAMGACGLDEWTRRMRGILDQFVAASKGHASLGFWRSFVRYVPVEPECGSVPFVDGWITAFIPPAGQPLGSFPLVGMRSVATIPADHGQFPVIIRGSTGNRTRYVLEGGFSGIAQAKDGALYPELGWSVWEFRERD